ncbi:MAG: nuclear transport factor 2 family protein [Flavobacteriales bacterium]|nr:nuclear transport factor 2 family protein [Flavobacteriales bacterium]
MRILFLIACLISTTLIAQSPLEVAQTQLDAYNKQDIDAFASVFSENAEVYRNIGDTLPSMVGREEIRKRYGAMFESNPENKSTLMGRMVQGNFVFDHEYITGRSEPFEIMAIYEIEKGKIIRCWFAR